MSKSKSPKFRDIWSNQTNLGKSFGLSAIAVGKILVEVGLKDSETNQPTEKALEDGYAKATPLKDGTPYYMWSKEKVRPLIAKDHQPLSEVDYWVNEVRKTIKEANSQMEQGNDKIGYMIYDTAYDDVPAKIKEKVRAIIEEESSSEK